MRIDFSRSGGFAAIRLTASIDTTELPTEQATHVDNLVQEADFFELPKKIEPETPGPDRFEYHVTVAVSHRTHTVVVHEAVAPENLKPLLSYLTTLAMVSRRR